MGGRDSGGKIRKERCWRVYSKSQETGLRRNAESLRGNFKFNGARLKIWKWQGYLSHAGEKCGNKTHIGVLRNIIGWKANVSETMGSTPVTGYSGAQHGS